MFWIINFVFLFTLLIIFSYTSLGIFSTKKLRRYLKKNLYTNYESVAVSPLSPSVSIISPAFNESANIVNNIKTLLNLHYANFEIIAINDGSTDNTFELMKEAFKLTRVNYFFDYRIPCERIRGVYKSTLPQFKKLTVIDKVNGGCKSDAINAGINVSKNDLIITIDSDSIIEPDSITKLVKPFLEQKKKKVIGTGGVIRILNSCKVEDGRVKEINLPKRTLPSIQVLEYTRAFLLGRMAWSQLDGLMLISGAMGMFDRETVIAVGGFDTSTIGEDMELVLRMRRHMAEKKEPYEVTYIPDPLCWTEVPSDYKSLSSQRVRWTRGLIDSLKKHSIMFFNPKYGKLGMLGFPFWTFFEWLAPVAAFLGIIYTIVLAILGLINWKFFFLLYAFIYSFSLMLSLWAILFEELTFHKYRRKRDVLRLAGMAFIEPFFYPMMAWFSVKGNWNHFFKKHKWGKIVKKGA